MKEFIEKLIERLEGRIKYNELCHKEFSNAKMSLTYEVQINAYKNAISIVNQLAEEYNNESVKGDLISRSALLKQFAEATPYGCGTVGIKFVDELIKNQPTAYNNGWILCSEKLPEENEEVILTFKNSAGLHVGEATYKNKMFFYVTDTQFGYYEEVYKNPIAWKYKDEPYQSKGE